MSHHDIKRHNDTYNNEVNVNMNWRKTYLYLRKISTEYYLMVWYFYHSNSVTITINFLLRYIRRSSSILKLITPVNNYRWRLLRFHRGRCGDGRQRHCQQTVRNWACQRSARRGWWWSAFWVWCKYISLIFGHGSMHIIKKRRNYLFVLTLVVFYHKAVRIDMLC